MKLKYKFLSLFIIILLLIIIIKISINQKSIIDIPLSSFTPFQEENNLIKVNTNFKIDSNLPTIEGASAFYPFSANLVQTIYTQSEYEDEIVKIVSTSEAFKDLINNTTDIAIATLPSDEQQKMIEESGIKLEFVPLFKEPIAFLVNKNNSINNLSIEEIKEMYYGNNLNWSEFGGNNKTIHTYQLEKNNGSQTCFENIVKNNALDKTHKEIKLMPEIINKVGKDKNGICYAFYSYYSKMHWNLKTKIINVNNEDINSENYPLLFDVYLIYRTDNKNDNIQKIVEWANSEEGQDIIKTIK